MNSAPATSTDITWLLSLLQAGDSFYPTGSYAHSFGLEGCVQAGVVRDRATLERHLVLSVLPGLQHTDLPVAAHAWHAFAKPDWNDVQELSVLSSAARASRESRLASENIGRQRAELAARLSPAPLASDYLQRATDGAWPFSAAVSAALEGRLAGAPLEASLGALFYSSVSAVIAAAMKLLRLGQNAAQTLLTETLSRGPIVIAAARETPREAIGWSNPWLDIAAARHETADTRMFIS